MLKTLEEKVSEIVKGLGYEEITLSISNRPDLGEYQINDAMRFAKLYHKNPNEIASEIVEALKNTDYFSDINVAGAGFINLTISDKFAIEFLNNINSDIKNNVDGIKDGESLVLRRTATDAADARAVSVETTSGTLIGYVPRRYGAVMARLMDAGKLLSAKFIGRDCDEQWTDITVAIEMREV